MSALARAWVQQVVRHAEGDLPDHVCDGILSCGDAAGALLGPLLIEPSTWDTCLAEHVIVLLGELRYAPEAQHLSDLLWDEPAYEDEVREALVAIGEPAIPPLVRHLALGRPVAATLAEIAAGQDRDDVRAAFATALRQWPELVRFDVGPLGDRALSPDLRAAIEALDPRDPGEGALILDLANALEELGEAPGESVARRVQGVLGHAAARRSSSGRPRRSHPRRRGSERR